MAAPKANYLIYFQGESQVYASATRHVALELPPPDGLTLGDKRIVFVTFEPDTKKLVVHPLPREEIINADIKIKEKSASKSKLQR